MSKIAQYAKFIAALIGAFVTAFSTLIPATWSPWATAAAAFLTAVAVILVPNTITDAQAKSIGTSTGIPNSGE